jgi:membrane protein required for colicin V production
LKINWVDIIIVVYIAYSFAAGKKRGLSVEFPALFFTFIAWATALNYYQGLGNTLSKWFLLKSPTASTIAFFGIAAAVLALGFLVGRFLKKIMKLSFVPGIEKIGGCIVGIVRGISMSAIIVVALVLAPADFLKQEIYVNSFLGNYFVALSPKAHAWIWPKKGESSNRFDVTEFMGQLPERPKKEVL